MVNVIISVFYTAHLATKVIHVFAWLAGEERVGRDTFRNFWFRAHYARGI